MPGRDIIVMGASAGGVETYKELVRNLPERLGASLFLVIHLSWGRSYLPEILSKAGRLSATHATDGESIRYDH
ncbi:MAG: chemotaxis protein CheB, partial [Desulforhabdus sp.]|nr:chemotaxis protein CheB [Desulforhabdus sp.]